MTLAVVRKELAVIWLSPLPYLVGALFNLVLGLLYVNQVELRQQALVQPLFPIAGFLLVAVVPLLAMRTFAEEARTGSLAILLAIPVRARALVIGKWVATWVTTFGVLAPSLVLVVLVQWWGDPDVGPIVSGYIGLTLLGGLLSALGVLASATTESQPVAAMAGFFVALLFWFSHVGGQAVTVGGLLAHVSLSERLHAFASGVVDSGDAGFLVIVSVVLLAVATVAVDLRRAG